MPKVRPSSHLCFLFYIQYYKLVIVLIPHPRRQVQDIISDKLVKRLKILMGEKEEQTLKKQKLLILGNECL